MSSPIDWTTLYRDAPISPRLAHALWWTASVTTNIVTRDPSRADVGLPPIALRSMDDVVWRERMAFCYRMVRDRLELAAFPFARCTGEELALHVTLAVSQAGWREGTVPPDDRLAGEPPLTYDDFDRARMLLFRDDTLLLLYEPRLDGVEDPASSINAGLSIGRFLQPAHWFDTFPLYDQAPPLAPLPMITVDVDRAALYAAAELAERSGGTAFVVYHVDVDARDWRAKVRFRSLELVGAGGDPEAAADDLARRIVGGGICPGCGLTIGTDCVWTRDSGTWQRGCA